jgi:hypothetical protein
MFPTFYSSIIFQTAKLGQFGQKVHNLGSLASHPTKRKAAIFSRPSRVPNSQFVQLLQRSALLAVVSKEVGVVDS